MRDWVLGEIVVAEARSGMPDAAFGTAGRIGDARLVVNALRDIVIGRAEAGEIEQALAASPLIPDPLARARALAAIAAAQQRAGQTAAVARTLREIATLVPLFDASQAPAQFLSDLAVALSRAGYAEAPRILETARRVATGGSAAQWGRAHPAGAAAPRRA